MNKIFQLNRLVALYLFSALSLTFVVYVVPLVGGFPMRTWSEFYQTLGKLIGIWGLIFGSAVVVFSGVTSLLFLHSATIKSFVLRFTTIELVLMGLFLSNLVAMVVGIVRQEPLQYVLGDTLKGSFIPLFYIWAKRSLDSIEKIVSFVKLVLIVESVLFIVLSLTDLIPFVQSTRTFLYTISFTLFYEEKKTSLRILFLTVTMFAIFIVMTTGAVRGTLIIFCGIVVLNILLRYQAKVSPIFMLSFLSFVFLIFVIATYAPLNLERNVTKISARFDSTLKNKNKKYFGLEESVFQRVGETIDVVRSFERENPAYILVGLGNGAQLNNVLMTPSEFSIYKSNTKHNIYITVVGVLFRQGLIGFILYVSLFAYLLESLRFYYRNRLLIAVKKEYVYLKVLILYHVSVVLYSFVAYLFVGNIVIAFTIPLHILLREAMRQEQKHQIVPSEAFS
jgi:hypothetical protein